MLEEPSNAFHQMQLDFINERLFISKNLNQYFENHFITSRFNTITTLKSGLIFFIDFENNESYIQHINSNLNLIEQLIESKNRKFIYNRDLKIENHHQWFVKYYYPFLEKNINPNVHSEINSLQLLEFTGILNNSSANKVKREDIKTGFLSIHSKGVSFIGKNNNETIEEFINKYIKSICFFLHSSEFFNNPTTFLPDPCFSGFFRDFTNEKRVKILKINIITL